MCGSNAAGLRERIVGREDGERRSRAGNLALEAFREVLLLGEVTARFRELGGEALDAVKS